MPRPSPRGPQPFLIFLFLGRRVSEALQALQAQVPRPSARGPQPFIFYFGSEALQALQARGGGGEPQSYAYTSRSI